MQPPSLLSDEEILGRCRRIFDDVTKMHEALDVNGSNLFGVEAGSSLAGDDRKSAPYHVSHAAAAAIGSALEQIHAVRTLVVEAGVLHPSAPYALFRVAIETAATAWWLLEPAQRTERVLRRMRQALHDAKDGVQFAHEIGTTPRRTLDERRARLLGIARRATGDPQTLPPGLVSTRIVKSAERCSSLDVLAAWKLCAGFAHGRTWPGLAVLDREVTTSSVDPDVVNARVTGSWSTFLWVLRTAYDVELAAYNLFRSRASNLM